MQVGTVKWFNNVKGFGFITPDEGSQDLFVHYSDIHMEGYRRLEPGQRVSYLYSEGPKGPAASQVVALATVDMSERHQASLQAVPA